MPERQSTTCRNCGRRIVWVPFGMRARWMHQPEGAAFQDQMNEHCHSTVAEPGDSE